MALTDNSRPFHTNAEAYGLEYPDGVRFAEDIALSRPETRVPTDRYTSRSFAHREHERLWKQVWQMACRHRGNTLRTGAGSCRQIRCRYHGWSWTLDGRLADIPDRHLTTGVVDDDYGLAEAAVGEWAGFVFLHPDQAA